ncbi:MAG: hypothetical protein KA436_05570 [Oligoflexales bacterium]|nr:hypothetical protein [Oligoflexales bacterium]
MKSCTLKQMMNMVLFLCCLSSSLGQADHTLSPVNSKIDVLAGAVKITNDTLGDLICFSNKKDSPFKLCIGRPISNPSRACTSDRWDSYHSARQICENKKARLLKKDEWVWLAENTAGAVYTTNSNAAGLVYTNMNRANFRMPDTLGFDDQAEYWMEEAKLMSLKEGGLIYSPYHYARCAQGLSVVCGLTVDLLEI